MIDIILYTSYSSFEPTPATERIKLQTQSYGVLICGFSVKITVYMYKCRIPNNYITSIHHAFLL